MKSMDIMPNNRSAQFDSGWVIFNQDYNKRHKKQTKISVIEAQHTTTIYTQGDYYTMWEWGELG